MATSPHPLTGTEFPPPPQPLPPPPPPPPGPPISPPPHGPPPAEPMDRLANGLSPPLPAFAVPHKRGWLRIPGPRGLLKPAPDLVWAVWVLPVQRAALEHALDRLGHVQPAAAHGRVERHDPMRAQPQHQLGCLVAGQIVPHQEKP